MIKFSEFCKHSQIDKQKNKIDVVLLIVYFSMAVENKQGLTINQINQYFEKAHLPLYNATYLKRDLTKDRRFTIVPKTNIYKITYSALKELDSKFSFLNTEDLKFNLRVNLNSTPFLSEIDVEGAHQMSQLYIILYCWENSVRKLIAQTLEVRLGIDWWDKSKNKDLDNKYIDRCSKEKKQKWVSPRGNENPLYYLDWGDLVKIIRKHENLFIDLIPDIKFIELRLEELERLRNIIAHNGLLPDENDIDRIIVHFKDWCNQLN